MPLTLLLSLVAVTLGVPAAPSPRVESTIESLLDSDDRHVVGLTRSRRLVVWDAATGKAIHVLEGYRQPIYMARISPDGRSVLGQSLEPLSDTVKWGVDEKGPRDRSMRLWDIASGKLVWEIPDSLFDAFSRDGRRIYGVEAKVVPKREPQRLVCWDLNTGSPTFTMPDFSPSGYLTNIAQESADGHWLLYSDWSGVTVFDLRARKRLVRFDKTMPLLVPRVAMVGNGERFFHDSPPGDSGSIVLYSIPAKKALDIAWIPGSFEVGWLPKSIGFVAYCNQRWLTYRPGVGLVKRGEVVRRTPRRIGPPDTILVSPDERNFAACYSTGEADGTATRTTVGYEVETCRKLWESPGRGVKFLPNGELILEDGDAVSFLDAASGVPKRRIRLEGIRT